MLRRSVLSRIQNAPNDVRRAIDGLLAGDKPCDVPTNLCHAVILRLTQMRKDAIIARKDALAAKMEVILGELQRGPQKYLIDTPGHPVAFRARSMSLAPRSAPLHATTKQLVAGARLDSIEIRQRQAAEPLLKMNRVRQVSRLNYSKSRDLDRTVDSIIEYDTDSRRLGPRLLRLQALESKLDEARTKYEACRERCRQRRVRFSEIRQDRNRQLEERLKDETVEHDASVPKTLPLEFSKFSAKLLDARERERKSAWFRRYDEATSLRRDALGVERDELDARNAGFARSAKLGKNRLLKSQDVKRDGFRTNWQRKAQEVDRACAMELTNLRRAIEHWERDVVNARRATTVELGRIRNNQRLGILPIQARPAATQRRF